MNKVRRGFTLVELLIVIVVIGILSTMMMLSSTEAVASAKATTIISNLRNLKIAAIAWYLDHMEQLGIGSDYYFHGETVRVDGHTYKDFKTIHNFAKFSNVTRHEILRYMNNDNISLNVDGDGWKEGHYRLFDASANNINKREDGKANEWYIGYYLPKGSIRQKIAGRAKSLGLMKSTTEYYDAGEHSDQVWLKVLDLKD